MKDLVKKVLLVLTAKVNEKIFIRLTLKLIENGKAYYAFDSSETLDQLRKEAEINKETFVYNWSCRTFQK